MQKVNVEIKGLTPYYFNKYIINAGRPPKGEKAEKELAMKKVHTNAKHLCFPGIQIQGCIIGGIRFMKMKLEKSMARAIDYVSRSLRVEPERVLFTPSMTEENIEMMQEPTHVDVDKVRDNWYSRISIAWGAKFTMEFPDFLPAAFVKEALETGGAYCGIGGRRNWKRGRFEVVKFEVS